MAIRIERRKGRSGLIVDINVRMTDGYVCRERRKAPSDDERVALRWAKKRERHLMMYGPGPGGSPRKMTPRPDGDGWVYFVRGPGGMIKIGWAMDVQKRLDALQTASPDPLVLIGRTWGAIAQERELHRRFAHLRVRREWFTPGPDLLQFMRLLPDEDALRRVEAMDAASAEPARGPTDP